MASGRTILGSLAPKWRAFGWKVFEINGHDVGEILDALDRTQAELAQTLKSISPEKLQAPQGERTLGEELAFYATHEARHTGQIELLRHK